MASTAQDLSLGKIPLENAALFMCDLQEKFRPAMLHFAGVIANAKKLVESAKIIGVPLIVTEQYPKGLGSTVSEIDVQHAIGRVPKTKFSMVVPEVEVLMKDVCNGQLKCAILFGVEAHVCVEQTAMDLIARGIKVHVVVDATTSRSKEDRLLAFERLRQIGCFITTSENVIYKLLGDKDHPKFNEVRPLIKDTTVETGLVAKMGETELTANSSWKLKIEIAHTVLTKLASEGSIVKLAIVEVIRELMNLKTQFSPAAVPSAIRVTSERSLKKLPPSRETKCPTCDKEFTRPQDLRRHLATHQPVPSFLCEECGKSYRSPDGLKYHKETSHPAVPVASALDCVECGKTFVSMSQLKVHMKNSHQRKKAVYSCNQCNPPAVFQRPDVFKAHTALHSQTPKPYSCPQCSKAFSSRSNLRSHSRTHAAGDGEVRHQPLQCPGCSKKFNSRVKLDLHTPGCLTRKCCGLCKFTCPTQEDMIRHMRQIHPAEYALQHVFGDALDGFDSD